MKPSEPSYVYLLQSLIYNQNTWKLKDVIDLCENAWGEGLYFEPSFNPSLIYYSKEMGEGLKRLIFCSDRLYSRDILLKAKLWAQAKEDEFSKGLHRSINIDIGALSLENFILATAKNYTHRIYLGEGIFGNLELSFENNEVISFPWTYEDYKHHEKRNFFKWLRLRLKQDLLDSNKEELLNNT